ncbi:hypothetical protein PI125_g7941 [Phytophthora idaei]|nr:hypothetical protein PI125_g7941 [Phytophthora idaei]
MDDDSRMSETSSVRNRGQRHASSLAGDLDAAGDAASLSASHIRPQLRCNACWEPILPDAQSAETCYRTSCGHLFCEKCAYKHFGQGRLQCPACSIDLSQARGGISETTIHGVADSKRTEAIWEEMMADPSSCFEHFQQALDFILFQLAQDSFRQVRVVVDFFKHLLLRTLIHGIFRKRSGANKRKNRRLFKFSMARSTFS